jgi:hypothetical protein
MFCEGNLQIPHMEFQKTFRIVTDIRLFNDSVVYVGATETKEHVGEKG